MWAGGVAAYPVLFGRLQYGHPTPLTVLGIVIFLSYATMQHLIAPRVLLILTPFLLLLGGIFSLTRTRTILYYLAAIDGRMLAKALIDIVAMRY